ncbi:MAG: NACHT domain-containing protein [Nostoc sp.]|uniref:NACHT domain-containing protein n=1 Tax=Nostoc sp. TaxID=1180 RepID=UPI002FF5D116
MLNQVKKFWIKDVLENRLHNKVRIELGLEERYDAINYPWTMVWETPDQSRHTLSPGTRVIDKFDELGVGRSLLILGEPGAGKTITLLELARDLIERAEHDIDFPIPVVLPLASWGSAKIRRASIIQKKPIQKKPSSFEDWLVEEISKYNISKKIVQAWLKNQELLLLLDGLDEVSVSYQEECVQNLNYFRQKYGQTEIVVCSRVQEYESLSRRLHFQAAIYLQPLTVQKIEHFFAEAGSELEAVRVMFQQDTTLQELAKSPLMLDIIALTYQGVSIENFPANKSVQEYRQHLFNDYIERMFFRSQGRHKAKRYHYTQSEAKIWLNWLAQKMIQESKSIFYIELMQPSLLELNKLQRRVFTFSISLIIIIALSASPFIFELIMQNVGWGKVLLVGIQLASMWSVLFVMEFIFHEIFDYNFSGSIISGNIITPVKRLKTTDIILFFISVVIFTSLIEIVLLTRIIENIIYIILQILLPILSLILFIRLGGFSIQDLLEYYKLGKIPEKKIILTL